MAKPAFSPAPFVALPARSASQLGVQANLRLASALSRFVHGKKIRYWPMAAVSRLAAGRALRFQGCTDRTSPRG
jgi:hypothetical protein